MKMITEFVLTYTGTNDLWMIEMRFADKTYIRFYATEGELDLMRNALKPKGT